MFQLIRVKRLKAWPISIIHGCRLFIKHLCLTANQTTIFKNNLRFSSYLNQKINRYGLYKLCPNDMQNVFYPWRQPRTILSFIEGAV
jgi:hypothetical protein